MATHPTLIRNRAALNGQRPKVVWKHFFELAARPRPSGLEEGVRTYIIAWSEDHGLTCYGDAIGNLIVKVPGRGAGIGSAAVIIQGHLDMVTEKNAGSEHCFESDPIALRIEGDILRADGTTLGADNGIGVAMALALGEGAVADHPPLELLFTVDEETGMSGARQLDTQFLTAARLINLDAEEEGILYVGCAGGVDTLVSGPLRRAAAAEGEVAVAITIRGLRGGHSGLDIQRNRGNAIRLLSRALLRLQRDGVAWRLVDFHGGSKRNAIPREAVAELRVRAEMVGRIPGLLQHYLGELKALHADAEADWELVFNLLEDRGKAPVIAEDAGHFISFLYTAPHGVLTLSAAIPGLVESSCNLGVVRCDPERFEVVLCVRSSNPAALAMIPDQIAAQGHGLGLVVRTQAGYPSWQPDMSSALLAIAARAYEEFAGSPPQITAIHAGLECGLLKELLPDCDMISFGPDIRNAHSPDEEVSIRSVGHVFGQVEVLLGHLCGPDQEAR